MTLPTIDRDRLRAAYEKVRGELLAERTPDGHWVGKLSSSALATGTAVSALAVVHRRVGVSPAVEIDNLIRRGVDYLVTQQNADGGFGDTDLSYSNIATTYLVVAALHLAGMADQHREIIGRAHAYIDSQGRLAALRERYGIDKTFVVPIMTNLALAGQVDWREVDPLPFELACVPQSWYRFVGMPVVSYAIPALVAIGQVRYFHAPPRNPFTRAIRAISVQRSLKVLRRMQPDSGGYLEATPLTSFVVMSLASAVRVEGRKSNIEGSVADEVIREGVKFLINSVRPDGSWPIDTNLATWNTTLAINALAGAGEDVAGLLGPRCLDWLMSCQHNKRHPFTGADPGGFGWSDLSGAVPDADDTPGAILALVDTLALVGPGDKSPIETCEMGRMVGSSVQALRWLIRLQNSDGGWPTFCRGWGRLPFDRSGADLTAHSLRALNTCRHVPIGFPLRTVRYDLARDAGMRYLRKHQRSDGSWSPLWFGNQDRPDEDNPVYGTAKVLMGYRDLGLMDSSEAQHGVRWLVKNQNEDGGWGSGVWARSQNAEFRMQNKAIAPPSSGTRIKSLGEPVLSTGYSALSTDKPISDPKSDIGTLKSSVEETALAVEALLAACSCPESRNATEGVPYSAVVRGLTWLIERVEHNQHRQPAPIGFYFAKLWYYERLYPLIFTVAALGRACRQFAPPEFPDSPLSNAPTDAP